MSQYDDYLRDYDAVAIGTKPAVIIERRKSEKAYRYVKRAMYVERLPKVFLHLKDSSGNAHLAMIVGAHGKELTISQIVDLIARREDYERDDFQITLGLLLGYTWDDCQSFCESRLSLTCGCQLCGGPTPQSRHDDACEARRTQFYV